MISITVYVTLASEFLTRLLLDRPIVEIQSPRKDIIGETKVLIGGTSSDASESGGDGPTPSPLKLGRPPIPLHVRLMLIALGFSTLCIFIRSVYRTIELSDGWEGRIISMQRYFDWLDGAMITLATYTLNIFHPGVLLKGIARGKPDELEQVSASVKVHSGAEDRDVEAEAVQA